MKQVSSIEYIVYSKKNRRHNSGARILLADNG